jgi:hypothetical protein
MFPRTATGTCRILQGKSWAERRPTANVQEILQGEPLRRGLRMADYYPLISRAVVRLKVNTEATRRVLYEGLRQAVLTQRGRRALDDAIRKVEMEVSGQPQSQEPHSEEQVEKEIKRLIRRRRAEQFLVPILLLIVLGSLLYMLVGLELLFIPRGIFQVIGLTVLVFIAALVFVISRATFFRIWSALH